jgi:glc operon protein GlcG
MKRSLVVGGIRVFCMLLLTGSSYPVWGQTQEKTLTKPTVLNLELAERFVAAARAKAQQNGWDMSFSVMDLAGHPVILTRMDKARWLTAHVAQSKAFTAMTFRRPSAEVEEMAKTRPQLWANIAAIAGQPLLPAGGGLPLISKGELLGGVGVSGGTEAQDVECARAGLDAIGGE